MSSQINTLHSAKAVAILHEQELKRVVDARQAEDRVLKRDENIGRTAEATESLNNKMTALSADLEIERKARTKGDRRSFFVAVFGVIVTIITVWMQYK